ncbi:MAG: hypothetical protein ACPGO3_14635 [Magnetospiraceae bacterium]
MGLGLRDSREMRRRQQRRAFWKWVVVVSAIIGAGIYAYDRGTTLAKSETQALKADVARLDAEVRALTIKNETLETGIAEEQARVADWKAKYTRDVPAGERKELFEKLLAKIEAGVSVERLVFVVDGVKEVRSCSNGVEEKRFLAQTPLYDGANDSVGFAGGSITVTALGESAVNRSGAPEAWFDPAKPVTATFTAIGGESTKIVGKLPLHQSVIVNDTEHRFTLKAGGGRGFVTVTYNTCAFP